MPEARDDRRCAEDWTVRHPIDWERFPAVVFESDDWGACEVAKSPEDAAVIERAWNAHFDRSRTVTTTLETPQDLDRLYSVLASFSGHDGQPAVFTAFACVGNPDFDAIRASGFDEYRDIAIDEGVPAGWERGDIAGAWRAGIARGVFAPQYHANLHHVSPTLWLRRLRAPGPAGDLARLSFDLAVYAQGEHLPEFECMNVREQHEWNRVGIERFTRAVGYSPAAAITSDAYPETETIWALLGIRIVCLKSCRVNSGQVVVYASKPWNNQDPSVPIGAHNSRRDVIYLTRNVFFECAGRPEQSAAPVFDVIRTRWSEGEPAMISTHRANYVSLDSQRAEAGLQQLDSLLSMLSERTDARFLTSTEVGDLYRRGWSVRTIGQTRILRRWSEEADEIRLPAGESMVIALPDGREFAGTSDGDETVFELPPGDYALA